MAGLDKTKVVDVGDGILMPLLQNRFRVRFDPTEVTPEGKKLISNQVVKTTLNLKQRTIEVWLEQPLYIENFIRDAVWELVKGTRICIDGMTGEGNGVPMLNTYCDCVNHEVVFDYAEVGTVQHKLTFTFKYVK